MMKCKVTEQIPNEFCRQEYIDKLNSIAVPTTGHIDQLKGLIVINGFNLPCEENERYGFILISTLTGKIYTRIYLNLGDAMAEEILLLHDEKMLKIYKI